MRNLVKGLLEIQIYYINWKPLIHIVRYKFQEFQQISKTRSLPNEPVLRFPDQFIFLNVFNNTIPYYRQWEVVKTECFKMFSELSRVFNVMQYRWQSVPCQRTGIRKRPLSN